MRRENPMSACEHRSMRPMWVVRSLLSFVFALWVGRPALGQTRSGVADPSSQRLSPEERALDGLPHYRPQEQVSGTIRLWGHGAPVLDFMGELVNSWEQGFQKFQPNVKF